MSSSAYADYLAGLDVQQLTQLLRVRPDVRLEPAPRGFEQLAQRLCGIDSLITALRSVTRDAVVVGQAAAVLGAGARVDTLADLLESPRERVRNAVDALCVRGLAWLSDGMVRVPERLAESWTSDIGGGRPVATIARSVLTEDLRATAQALGISAAEMRKTELVGQVGKAFTDFHNIVKTVQALPTPARKRLETWQLDTVHLSGGYATRRYGDNSADGTLADAGLLLRTNNRWELPREVSIAIWLAEVDLQLTGPPEIAMVDGTAESVTGAAAAAVQELLAVVTALLDEAAAQPITALKMGGVGSRERSRLAARLATPRELVTLSIDVAYAAGLLSRADSGYAPTQQYSNWRTATSAQKWAALAITWFRLEHAPSSRILDDDKELPPPLPLASAAGEMRRALLRGAADGRSVAGTAQHIDWFFPLHGYPDDQRDDRVASAMREAELLGIVAADVVTECGQRLLTTFEYASDTDETVDVVAELALQVEELLPDSPCSIVLQSDLTAVVSGMPNKATSRILSTAATKEVRGAADIWRFGAAGIRAALDTGWTSQQLVEELTAAAGAPLPQTLEYLIRDEARKHGKIRLRSTRCVLVADEATVTEILHTRSLAKLRLTRLAPTVLTSAGTVDDALTRLRAAGHSPVAEDTGGTVIVHGSAEHRGPAPEPGPVAPSRIDAARLAERLRSDPSGTHIGPSEASKSLVQLAALNPKLEEAELVLLADAVDHRRDIRITYRDNSGSYTSRAIRPMRLYDRWLDSWCHLRNDQRNFAVANIKSVTPVG